MRNFEIVVAVDLDGGIGKDGTLPWNLPGDMAHFKRVTTSVADPGKRNAVIMGRKTWDSIPPKFRPLRDRLNIVISRKARLDLPSGVLSAQSIDEALACADRPDVETAFVIGGAAIYEAAVSHPNCTRIMLTEVLSRFDCDTFFPAVEDSFSEQEEQSCAWHADNGVDYVFKVLERIKTTLVLVALVFLCMQPGWTADPKDGQRLFSATCAMCHPGGGNVLNPAKCLKGAQFLKDFPADTTIVNVVRKGIPGTAMDAFPKERISDAQLSGIIAYIRSLTPAQPLRSAATASGGTPHSSRAAGGARCRSKAAPAAQLQKQKSKGDGSVSTPHSSRAAGGAGKGEQAPPQQSNGGTPQNKSNGTATGGRS